MGVCHACDSLTTNKALYYAMSRPLTEKLCGCIVEVNLSAHAKENGKRA